MARQKIVPGAEIETLSADELRGVISEAFSGVGGAPETVMARANKLTDASGNLSLELYIVPAGQEFVLTRLVVEADGKTPASPFTGAGSYLQTLRNDEVVDFTSLAAGTLGLPAISTDGEDSAPVFRQGDRVIVRIVSGPATTNVVASMRGIGYGLGDQRN